MENKIVKLFTENGLSVVAVDDRKIPLGSWKKYQSSIMQDWEMSIFNKSKGIAVVSGKVSGNLELIDIDSKYDLTGDMYERYIKQIPKELFEKLVIQTTVGGGYHILYRCNVIEGNQKLAQRETTEEEKKLTPNQKFKVLFETRGEGGYFLVAPSNGYKVIQGKFSQINLITPSEREFLLELARSFTEYVSEQHTPREVQMAEKYYQISPFEDYNSKCDVPSLLAEHGWTIGRQYGNKYLLRRPGTDNQWSAEYDRDKNWFTVFSTSTEFEPLKAYKPYAVYATLNGITDWSQLNKKLSSMGFGIKNTIIKKKYEDNVKKMYSFDETTEEENDGDISFLSSWGDTRSLVEDFISGKIPMGLDTGFRRLDEYFRFKRGNLVIINGHDNAGKTTLMLYLAMISAVRHGWKWCLFSGENSAMSIMNSLIQFYSGTPIHDTSESQRNEAQTFIEKHFVNFNVEELNDYKTFKKKFTKVKQFFNFDAMLVDPYNSLDASGSENSHSLDYAVINDIKIWGRANDVSIYINTHAVTSALRKVDGEGYVIAPNKGDAEGGTKFAAKADEWLTVHRIANHKDEMIRKITEIHIRKVKETYTGGKQTPIDKPFTLLFDKKGAVFYDAEDALRNHPFLGKKQNLDFEDILNDPF